MNGEKSPAPSKPSNAKQRSEFDHHQSTPKIETHKKRPVTPEIDYDSFGNVHVTEKPQGNRQAAVF